MSVDLIIRYHHDMLGKEHVCTGDIRRVWSEGEQPPELLADVQKQPFNWMMSRSSEFLNNYTVDRVIIERTDRIGLQPIVLDNPTAEILKKDPALAIRLMNYNGPTVADVSGKTVTRVPIIRAGYDTVAEAFGDEVYCRMRGGLVECPGCGLWSSARQPFECKKRCGLGTTKLEVRYTAEWAVFKVGDLLALSYSRYYLPRGWNPSASWISWKALKKMYAMWRDLENSNQEKQEA